MMVTLKKYSLVFLGLLLLSACRQNFEWVNINPDKLISASKGVPYQKGVRNISLTFDLQEKQKEIYFNSTEDYIAKNTAAPAVVSKPQLFSKRNNYKNAIAANRAEAPKKIEEAKKIEQPNLKVVQPVIKAKEVPDLAADKLNEGLKIPEKEKNETIKQIVSKRKILPVPQESSNPAVQLNQAKQNDTKQIIQKELQGPKRETAFEQFISGKKGNSFLLAGLVLVVMGVVLGLIFGKAAFLVAIAGVVFSLIGLILKM